MLVERERKLASIYSTWLQEVRKHEKGKKANAVQSDTQEDNSRERKKKAHVSLAN